MLKTFRIIIFTLCIIIINGRIASAALYNNFNDLIENGKNLDNKVITLQGEVIGDRMKRGDYSWVNVSDGSNAIGIWMKNEDADKISVYGSYKYKGDKIQIQGVFNRACRQHGGDMDIHAQSLKIITPGYTVKEEIKKDKVIAAAALTVFTLLLGIMSILKRTR